jgi:hypothetical protein
MQSNIDPLDAFIGKTCNQAVEFPFGSPLNNQFNEAVSYFFKDSLYIYHGMHKYSGKSYEFNKEIGIDPINVSIETWSKIFTDWGVGHAVGAKAILLEPYRIIALSIELDLVDGVIPKKRVPDNDLLSSKWLCEALDMIDILYLSKSRLVDEPYFNEVCNEIKEKGVQTPLKHWLLFISLVGDVRAFVIASKPSAEMFVDLSDEMKRSVNDK